MGRVCATCARRRVCPPCVPAVCARPAHPVQGDRVRMLEVARARDHHPVAGAVEAAVGDAVQVSVGPV